METGKFAIIGLILVLAGCATTSAPPLTPLEIQSLQTREYEYGKDIVFPSVMSVFQSLGYVVKSANKDTGLITAEGPAESDAGSRFWGISSVSQTFATAFIEEIGKKHKSALELCYQQ